MSKYRPYTLRAGLMFGLFATPTILTAAQDSAAGSTTGGDLFTLFPDAITAMVESTLPLATILTLIGLLPLMLYGSIAPEDSSVPITLDASVQHGLLVFAWLIPGSVVFVLVAFALFYRAGLLKPMNLLLEGVRRIQSGDLQVEVPVLAQDEIGFFAQNLNQMAASLKASQEELEQRVEERTAELQASLARLKATQAQLVQQEKMASIGQLTAGIAHDTRA